MRSAHDDNNLMGNPHAKGLGDALRSAGSCIDNVRPPAGYLLHAQPGKLSWWHKSISTMDNLAKRYPAFATVYDSVRNFIGDASRYAVVAADLAPRLLPRLESVKGVLGQHRKKAVSAAVTTAIAASIFEGTLAWARAHYCRGRIVQRRRRRRAIAGSPLRFHA